MTITDQALPWVLGISGLAANILGAGLAVAFDRWRQRRRRMFLDEDDQWPPLQETYPGSGIYE